MPDTPFFSVIIPTKNRSYRVASALRSVLRQTFSSYEIIVVDNDDTAATADVVRQFTDPRIRYVRTGGLSMADNWERGRQEARGEYLKILPDRHLLKGWALEKVHQIVEQEKTPAISWRTGDIDDSDPQAAFFKLLYKQPARTRTCRKLDSGVLLRRFLREGRRPIFDLLPRGINSACHRSLVKEIVDGPLGRLCPPVSPDYTMAFAQLAYSDTIVYLDETLNISCSGDSNGREFRTKAGSAGATFVRDTGTANFYNRVPVKAVLTQNMLLNDFLNMQALLPEKLAAFPLSPVDYFVQVYADIRLYELVGVKTGDDLRAWEAALSEQPPDIQAEVRAGIVPYARRYALTLGNRVDYVWLQQAIRAYRKAKGPRFDSVLAALEWEEQTIG